MEAKRIRPETVAHRIGYCLRHAARAVSLTEREFQDAVKCGAMRQPVRLMGKKVWLHDDIVAALKGGDDSRHRFLRLSRRSDCPETNFQALTFGWLEGWMEITLKPDCSVISIS